MKFAKPQAKLREVTNLPDPQKKRRTFKDAVRLDPRTIVEDASKTVLFVGTERQLRNTIKEKALHPNQFYINRRWLGGLLTNFQTIQKSIKRYKEIEAMQADGRIEQYAKKERLEIERERLALEKNLAGIKEMRKLPDVIFIIDTGKEEITVKEANRLGIPVVAIVDTNCSPEGVDYVVPSNDDALRAVRLFAARIADAIAEGQKLTQQKEREGAEVMLLRQPEMECEMVAAKINARVEEIQTLRAENEELSAQIKQIVANWGMA